MGYRVTVLLLNWGIGLQLGIRLEFRSQVYKLGLGLLLWVRLRFGFSYGFRLGLGVRFQFCSQSWLLC